MGVHVQGHLDLAVPEHLLHHFEVYARKVDHFTSEKFTRFCSDGHFSMFALLSFLEALVHLARQNSREAVDG
ncbi:MAG: hypothetical protein NVSMB27_23290 [Ktedonobacteraceae bacterium]